MFIPPRLKSKFDDEYKLLKVVPEPQPLILPLTVYLYESVNLTA